jgi:transcriptional regulator with XRE-family HTH domain
MTIGGGQLGDTAVLAELGSRLGAVRLARNLTQAELAKEAGISKRTLERIEAGQSAQLTSFIRVLRALDLLERLELLLPPVQPGPMDLLRHGGKPPQRASGRGSGSPEPWTWAEDDA